MSLSARIMNLPLDGFDSAPENSRAAYFSGHRDARHAAAELAAEADATIAALRGENGVFRGLLRAADNTLDTIDEDSDASAEGLAALRQSIDAALKRTLPQTGMVEADAIRDELVAALTEARRIVKDARDAFGPCDHAVGICNCDMDRSIEASDAALARAKGQA